MLPPHRSRVAARLVNSRPKGSSNRQFPRARPCYRTTHGVQRLRLSRSGLQAGLRRQSTLSLQEASVTRLLMGMLVCCLSGLAMGQETNSVPTSNSGGDAMRLGNFSVSLAVKDIAKSRAFYEKLGFRVFGGDQAKNWLILQNDTSTIGLFQGMFDKNIMTFNPGWDRSGNALPDFDDVRDIQKTLKNRGLALTSEADDTTTGPASLMLLDPDGNPVLIDQHVPKPQQKQRSGGGALSADSNPV